MRAILLVSVIAFVEAHRENRMVQQVEQSHLVTCVVTVVQRHFPVGRNEHLSSTADDDHKNSVLVVIHRLDLCPIQVTEPSTDSVSQPN